jgi:Rod binding domain-containing protein
MNDLFSLPGVSTKPSSGGFLQPGNLSPADRKNPKLLGAKFEAMFYRMILKQTREASLGDPLFGSSQTDSLKEMQDDEMSNVMGAEGHLGVVKMITDYMEEMESDRIISPKDFDTLAAAPAGLIKDTK